MRQGRHVRWLYDELETLVEEGVIDAQAAQRLRAHYGEPPAGPLRRAAVVIFAILGALLIGAGIVLLLAHNWEELSRPLRAVIAIAPLLVVQVLGGWVLLRRNSSAGWREGTATALCAAVIIAIALIGQTYHIPGDLGRLLLTWSLLIIPAVYLLDSVMAAFLYMVAITSWAAYAHGTAGHAPGFWPLAALAAPYLWRRGRRDLYGPPTAFLFWTAAGCATIALGLALKHVLPGIWIVAYSAMFALMYLAGRRWMPEDDGFWRSPLRTFGAAGIGILSLVLTFREPWKDVARGLSRRVDLLAWPALGDYAVTGVLLVGAIVLLAAVIRRRAGGALYGAAPLLAAAGLGLVMQYGAIAPVLIAFNAYLFALGVGTLMRGVRDGRLSTANGGLALLAMLIVARFFDADVPFTLRGLAFIAVGIGFLVANVLILRRWKGAER